MGNRKIYDEKDAIKRLNSLKPTLNSSLGHLAYGHITFKLWRALKREKMNTNE